jgi:hypothetical protein
MAREKAAVFVDNSNIFKGMYSYSRWLVKQGMLREGQYLRMRWDTLLEMLEAQDGGLDIFARHFLRLCRPQPTSAS